MNQETQKKEEFQILLMHEVTNLNTNSKDLSLLRTIVDDLEANNSKVLNIYKDGLTYADGFVTMDGKQLPIYGIIMHQNDYMSVNLYLSIKNRLVLYVVDRFISEKKRLMDIVDDFEKETFLFYPSSKTIEYLCNASRIKYYNSHKTPYSNSGSNPNPN